MGIKSLSSIISKNLKILGRSKFSTIAIILTPFLIILFAGFVFDSSGLTGINLAVYSGEYSNLTNEILEGFEEQNFVINKFESQQDCIESVKIGKTQICIIFPKDLSETGSAENIVFHVDYSRINLAYTLIHEIESKISIKASSLGISLAQELIETLDFARNSLPEQKIKISSSEEKLNQIDEKTENKISLSEIEEALGYLNSAKGSVNDSQTEKEITDTIIILESLKSSISQVSENLEDIGTQTHETSLILSEVLSDINSLIEKINQTSVLEAEKIVSPIKTKVESVNTNSNNKNHLLPTVLSLIALFGGILLASTFILKERKTKAYFRNFITPTRDFTFLLGNYFTCLIILIVQFVFVFIGVEWILKVPLSNILVEIILILFLSLSAFIFIGMFIGYLFKSEETTIFASVLIATLMMFFSNTILPIETFSGSFKNLAMFNPLVVCDIALKKVISFNFNYVSLLKEIYILGGFVLFFAILSYLGRKITKRML